MTDKEMNKLADIIVDKLLTTYIREQATWYTTNTDAYIERFFPGINKKAKKGSTEEEL